MNISLLLGNDLEEKEAKENYMKNLISACVMLMIAVMLAAVMPTEAEAKIYEDTLRLHILAPSDSSEDQALKLRIRDRVLNEYGERLGMCDNIAEAEAKADGMLSEIEKSVCRWIAEDGYSYSASVTLSKEWYDTREYEGFTLPRGVYTSLRIIIGEGEGKNWWCIMYPPLCLDVATEGSPDDDGLIDYTSDEKRLIVSGKYNVKFKLLEIFSDAFSSNR